jgi:hypothetical protein
MGIDAPAFGRSVDRPQDTAVEGNALLTDDIVPTVSSGSSANVSIHTNSSGSQQFLLVVSVGELLTPSSTLSDDVTLSVSVLTASGSRTFQIRGNGSSLLQTLPSLVVEDGGEVVAEIRNSSSSNLTLEIDLTLRQG